MSRWDAACEGSGTVLVLSDVKGVDAVLEALPDHVAFPNLDAVQFRSVREVPDVGLHLTGLADVVIHALTP